MRNPQAMLLLFARSIHFLTVVWEDDPSWKVVVSFPLEYNQKSREKIRDKI